MFFFVSDGVTNMVGLDRFEFEGLFNSVSLSCDFEKLFIIEIKSSIKDRYWQVRITKRRMKAANQRAECGAQNFM